VTSLDQRRALPAAALGFAHTTSSSGSSRTAGARTSIRQASPTPLSSARRGSPRRGPPSGRRPGARSGDPQRVDRCRDALWWSSRL